MHDFIMVEDSKLWNIILDGPHVAIKEVKEEQITIFFPSTWRVYNEVYCNKIEKRYKANKLLIYGIGPY